MLKLVPKNAKPNPCTESLTALCLAYPIAGKALYHRRLGGHMLQELKDMEEYFKAVRPTF